MVLVAYESPDLLEKLAQNLAMGMVDLRADCAIIGPGVARMPWTSWQSPDQATARLDPPVVLAPHFIPILV